MLQNKSTDYGILIPFINNRFLLEHCLKSIRQTAECVIHVCCDEPGHPEDIRAICNKYNANLLFNDCWLGYTRTVNRLAEIAQEPFLIFCNCDVVVTPGWLQSLYQAWCETENPGMIAAKTISMHDGSVNYSGLAFGTAGVIGLWQYSLPHHALSAGLRTFQAVSDCCSLVEHSTYDVVSPRDEKYLVSWSDLDTCLSLRSKGYTNACSGDCTVYHHGHVSSERRFLLDIASRTYFFSKWRNVLVDDAFDWLYLSYASLTDREYLQGKKVRFYMLWPVFDEDTYLHAVGRAFDVEFSDVYRLPSKNPHPHLFSCFGPEAAEDKEPAIYLFRSYRDVWENHLWFAARKGRGDVAVDYFGNAVLTDSVA